MQPNPEYSLTPIVRRSKIDPGDTIEIELYVVGHGPVDKGKLQVFHLQNDLIDSATSGEFVRWVDSKSSISGDQILIRGEEAKEKFGIDNWNTVILLRDWFFENIPDDSGRELESGIDLGIKTSEAIHDNHPPLLLRLRVSSDAKPGNYELPMVFTYILEDSVNQDSETISIHVNSWVDRHRTELEIIGVVGVLGTILTVLFMAI